MNIRGLISWSLACTMLLYWHFSKLL